MANGPPRRMLPSCVSQLQLHRCALFRAGRRRRRRAGGDGESTSSPTERRPADDGRGNDHRAIDHAATEHRCSDHDDDTPRRRGRGAATALRPGRRARGGDLPGGQVRHPAARHGAGGLDHVRRLRPDVARGLRGRVSGVLGRRRRQPRRLPLERPGQRRPVGRRARRGAGRPARHGRHAPTAIEVDGRAGQARHAVAGRRRPGHLRRRAVSPWFEADGDSRFYAAPGETETVWIVDLDGHRAVLNAGSVVEVAPATRAQLDEMLASIRIG